MTVDRKDILVVGAGPAGLVAAINLNREGFNVILHERQDRIGGEPGFHPSVHGTPVDMPGLWDYIGIDLSEFFVPTDIYPEFWYNSKRLTLPPMWLTIRSRGAAASTSASRRATTRWPMRWRIASGKRGGRSGPAQASARWAICRGRIIISSTSLRASC